MNKIIDIIKNCNKYHYYSQQVIEKHNLKLISNKERTWQQIKSEFSCKTCNHTKKLTLTIEFVEPQDLTIFHVGMLWGVLVLNKKPLDYATYHKCIAGKRFFENIKKWSVKNER